jgi:hypothetical protein
MDTNGMEPSSPAIQSPAASPIGCLEVPRRPRPSRLTQLFWAMNDCPSADDVWKTPVCNPLQFEMGL